MPPTSTDASIYIGIRCLDPPTEASRRPRGAELGSKHSTVMFRQGVVRRRRSCKYALTFEPIISEFMITRGNVCDILMFPKVRCVRP